MAALPLLLALLPVPASACPSCSPGDERTQGAYLASTAILSLLPLLMIGLGGLVFTRLSRKSRSARTSPTPPHID